MENVNGSTTIEKVCNWILDEHKIPIENQKLSLSAKMNNLINGRQDKQLSDFGVKHGDLLYLEYPEDIHVATYKRKVNADGNLEHVEYDDRIGKTGFRPGLKSLRDMKMHWTIGEFMRMDAEFEYKIKRQEESYCKNVSLDADSCNSIQSYLRQFAFQQCRCAWLYGHVTEDKKVVVDCIYEPPQEGDMHGFNVHDDAFADKVDLIANELGMTKVGWLFSHPPREDTSFLFSSREVLLAAQLQHDAGGSDSPFVTVKVTLNADGEASFEAFQVSDQCIDLFTTGALLENTENPQSCTIHPTFTALVESKPATQVDNNFFLLVVPVLQHNSFLHNNLFPSMHRDGTPRTRQQLANAINQTDKPYHQRLANLSLLVFLADFLDYPNDLQCIARCIHADKPIDSGYQVLIDSIAGK